MRSLEGSLLRWIVGMLALGTLLVTGVAYKVTSDEMHEVFDAELQTIAEGVASMLQANRDWSGGSLPERHDEPDDVEIVTLIWKADGRLLYSSDPRYPLPFSRTAGHEELTVGAEHWIRHTVVREGFVAQAAQRRSQRQQMAGESAVQISSVMVGLVAIVGLLLVYSLRRGLAPLDRAARDLATRSARTLEPIDAAPVPRELQPVLDSTNALLRRLGDAFALQRRFLADAAHELRTPITALRLQLQVLQRSPDEGARAAALAELQAGIERSQHLVEQLLDVARSEPEAATRPHERVDLVNLARQVASAFAARADARGVDLGVRAEGELTVQGDAQQLTVLLNNLVDNAIRYAPQGEVDVQVGRESGRALLRVVDAGPGIPADERARAFDRFFRGSAGHKDPGGSGLGLAIVRALAERHGASVDLEEGPGGRGLAVSVRFGAGDSGA